jgi:adenosine deaminase
MSGSIDAGAAQRNGQDDVDRLLAAMPKAELHLHLDGSVRVETALELAASRGVPAPGDATAMRAMLVAPERCADQAELLRAYDLPIALLQDAEALGRVTEELVEAKAAEQVRYCEIRWAPLLHLQRGLRPPEVIAAVVRSGAAAARRTGVAVRFICTALRTHDPAANLALAETAARFRDDGLTGWDLAGPEAAAPDPLLHVRAFDAARAAGLHITVHAGEWGGASQVRRALEVTPERIAHGPGAIDDSSLVATLIERDVTLDLCPTSNVQAGIVPSIADHPIARLHRLGVPVTLSTDELTVADITLTDEYRRAVERIGLTIPELWSIDRHALDVAFVDGSTRDRLRSGFEAWAATVPEVHLR